MNDKEKIKVLRDALAELVERRKSVGYGPNRLGSTDGRYIRAQAALDLTAEEAVSSDQSNS